MALSSEAIQLLLAVLDHGSFSAAARALGRVPSAISMAVAQLEAELDLQLFDRSGREPVPTEAALALAPRARHVAAQLRQLDADALSLHAGLERRLTLALVPELSASTWTGALAQLAEEFPSLEVEVRATPQADALKMLHAGEAQLALVFERDQLSEREGLEEIGQDFQVAVMSRRLQRRLAGGTEARPRLEDLVDLRQIVVASRDGEHGHRRLVHSRYIWHSDSPHAALDLVEAGIGWAFLPRALVAPRLSKGGLVAIEFDNISEGQVGLWVDVVWSKDRPLGLAARRFIALSRARRLSPSPPSRSPESRSSRAPR